MPRATSILLLSSSVQSQNDSGQCALDVSRLKTNLAVTEAHRRIPSSEVSLVSDAIAVLLRSRSVVPKAVRFDDQTQITPEEVDFPSVAHHAGLRRGETDSPSNRAETPLEL